MGTLVCNGRTLYRRDGFLVRSPIYRTLTIEPDEIAYYMIAGSYDSSGWPQRGFINTPTTAGAIQTAYQLNNAFINKSHSSQIWRQASLTAVNKPNNLFYNGTFSCWGPIPWQSEAFEMVAAYHFTLPPTYKDSEIGSIKWNVQHKGQIASYQDAKTQSAKNFHTINYTSKGSNFNWIGNTNWDSRYWDVKVGAYSRLNDTIMTMYNSSLDTITMDVGFDSGNPTGWEQVWTNGSGGAIPITTVPYTRNYDLSNKFSTFLQTNKSFWIVGMYEHNNSQTYPEPAFYPPSGSAQECFNYYVACTWRTLNITVNLQVFD